MPNSSNAIFANGQVFADAFLSGVILQTENSPILLVKNNELPVEVRNYIQNTYFHKKTIHLHKGMVSFF